MTKRAITIPSGVDPVAVLGPGDSVLREVERAFPTVNILARGNRILLQADSAEAEGQALRAQRLLETVIDSAYSAPLDAGAVQELLDRDRYGEAAPAPTAGSSAPVVKEGRRADSWLHEADWEGLFEGEGRRARVPGVIAYAAGRPVRPKTRGQTGYVNAIASHTITFGIGPAGTGKTYLAVAKAVQAFRSRQVSRIILTRPAVEAGENLGFLPGGLTEKVDPYLRPLYDALSDMLGGERMRHFMENGAIEVAPLAYMRGRTLNDAFVILDEAQNTTRQQMKMFLTRLGFNSKMVITGDVTQVDLGLPASGLVSIEEILGGVEGIAFVHLAAGDVVRHQLVGRIVEAYERYASARPQRKQTTSDPGEGRS
ncbi:PhoH family protein [Bifidobacterium actinocoloniiforme DSM 22766]|uniref:PhoH-like protein n=1 Tax=Bifidobacterium actinocoloniiforme DSM 22766 TaxID=1437605 RepID=A0A086Z098_9BIFI|nr:PhoH family protein [Bifidobacterium actinocoloniiforme DSM 22766]